MSGTSLSGRFITVDERSPIGYGLEGYNKNRSANRIARCLRIDSNRLSPRALPVAPFDDNIVYFFRKQHTSFMISQGSAGNVIAALASFFIPGLGQLVQGRVLAALTHSVVSGLLWFISLGWLGHIVSCIDAARWKGP